MVDRRRLADEPTVLLRGGPRCTVIDWSNMASNARTSHQALLKGVVPDVDRAKVGISYSGGGPRVVLEFGAAMAFINAGIVPDVIAGVSAGALAATAHVLDPGSGRGIAIAAEVMPKRISTKGLGLTIEGLVEKVIRDRGKLQSFGDNSILRGVAREVFTEAIGEEIPTIGRFGPPDHPLLMIAAADWLTEGALWFGNDTPIEDALLASGAIPGIFPWRHHDGENGHSVLVDGGVISNQPLSRLVLEGCGTILACGFSTPPRAGPEPSSALHSVLDAIQMLMHQCSHLEEDYVRLKLGDTGDIHRLLIDSDLASHDYDFTPALIRETMANAEQQVTRQLRDLGYPR